MAIEKDSSTYNVLGINTAEVDLRQKQFEKLPEKQKEIVRKVFEQTKKITTASAKLDKIGNFWSFPVSNLVGMYNYQNYMPFKGVSKHSVVDQYTSYDNKATGSDLQDKAYSADGRFSVSDNPFLQMMSDAFRSAGRAGRRNYMSALRNAVKPNKYNPNGTGVIDGEVVKRVEFMEKTIVNLDDYKKPNYIFVYNPDGSTDIISINDPKLVSALRYTIRDANPALDMARTATSFVSQGHTRFNYNFPLYNFVRDTFTNATVISAEKGIREGYKYAKETAVAVVKNGLGKGLLVSILHDKGDPASQRMLADMAMKDPFAADMIEWLQFGGKTTFMQNFSLKSSLEELDSGLDKNRIIDTAKKLGNLADIYNSMFEFTSRTAAYSIKKQELLNKYITEGTISNEKGPNGSMSPAEIAASTEAAAYAKSLANFEDRGASDISVWLNALYGFYGSSVTGGVRAVEAILPAMRSLNSALNDLPQDVTEAEKEKFKAAYLEHQRNARNTIYLLTAAGFGLYLASMAMSPEDEWGRNSVRNDNMDQWLRNARIHIPNSVSEQLGLGRDVVYQMPWGFGPGAFMAIGAQVGGLLAGASTAGEAISNIGLSLFDSFLPLPVSRIPLSDSPDSALTWAIDTITPTLLRAPVEYVMNVNGIGKEINSNSHRRLDDAFLASDRTPLIYKDLSAWMYDNEIASVSPNTLFLYANSYIDGQAKLAELLYSWANLQTGQKEFNVKTDAPLIGSFFGTKPNIDSRIYGEMEKKIIEIDKKMNTLKQRDQMKLLEYKTKNPLHEGMVGKYKARQGELNKLREDAKEIRMDPTTSPKEKTERLRFVMVKQNYLKYQMVQDFKAYGLER